jgi:hypothetical protein
LSLFLTMGGSSAFSPSDISGLSLWLDASDAATLFQDSAGTTPAAADSDPVGRWADKSGAGRHHTQSADAKRPALRKAAQNARDALEFDGANDCFNAAVSFQALAAGTAFFVVKIDQDPPATSAVSGLCNYGSDSNVHFPFDGDGVIYDNWGTTARKTTVNPATTLAQWNVYAAASAAGAWANWLNGAQLFTTGTNTVGWVAQPSCRLGANSAETFLLDGRIGEVVVYDSFLPAGNRQAVEAYLKAKWATP